MAHEFVQLNVNTTTGAKVAVDQVVTGADILQYQLVQLVKGGDSASKTLINTGAGLPVTLESDSVGLASEAGSLPAKFFVIAGDNGTNVSPIQTDTSGAIKLGAGTATIGTVGLKAGTATVGFVKLGASTATIGTAAIQNAHSADFDTGAGTDTTAAFGIAVPGSGGAKVIPGATGTGLLVDVSRIGGGTATIGSINNVAGAVLAAGTATVGTVVLQSAAAVALKAGTATVGTMAFQAAAAVGLNAGTATVGTVALQAAAAIALNAGTATIGSINAVASVPARTATNNAMTAIGAQNRIMVATGAAFKFLAPKYANLNRSASGTTTIAAAAAGVKHVVLRWDAVSTIKSVAISFRGATGTATGSLLAGPYNTTTIGQGGGVAVNYCQVGLFQTATGKALRVHTNGGGIGGSITYISVS